MKNLYQHGGNIYEIRPERRPFILDFSANINPLGIPTTIKKLLNKQIKDLIHYPDPHSRYLVAKLACYWKIKEENILVGNGSTELIYLILNAFRDSCVSLVVPSFTEYERAARISKCQLKFIYLHEEDGFRLNPKKLFKKSNILFLCNPNNPTGNLLISNAIDIEKLPIDKVVIDEAFMDFVSQESIYTFIPQAVQSKKIIVLRTLTKFFALAGLRIGYLVAHKDVIQTLKEYQMPWNVNILAQIAAAHCLDEVAFIKRSRRLIEKERLFLYSSLSKIKGLKPYSSLSNFLLVKIEKNNIVSPQLKEMLLEKNILIRDCSNFRGLDERFIRVAVHRHKENMQLIKALEECIRY